MSFDWQQESKERYFSKAEEIIKAAGYDDILKINKDSFGISKDKVKVYFKPIPRKGNTHRWWGAKRMISGIKEQSLGRNKNGKEEKCIYIYGYIVLEMGEQDK